MRPVCWQLVYSAYLEGSDDDVVIAIAVDTSGNAYVTGYTDSTSFPTAKPVQASLSGPDVDADRKNQQRFFAVPSPTRQSSDSEQRHYVNFLGFSNGILLQF
jgi:hypothetical protein